MNKGPIFPLALVSTLSPQKRGYTYYAVHSPSPTGETSVLKACLRLKATTEKQMLIVPKLFVGRSGGIARHCRIH